MFAVFGNALPYSLISWGQTFIDSGLAGILMAIMPLITLVLSHFVIPGERLTRYRVFGFLVGFCGIVVLMGPDELTAIKLGDSQLVAMLAVLGGAVCYAIAAVLARLRPAGDALVGRPSAPRILPCCSCLQRFPCGPTPNSRAMEQIGVPARAPWRFLSHTCWSLRVSLCQSYYR